ncbi:Ankyrin repeat-containing domain [Pseudocohnilembus persalinus]|uniref:Ankyrin repeat-containing domain n=1 Tax=Pseudocohnilembus persalinus TaxID=266149 RepID=A0A0V0R0J1_PSEPJ|nr:Ankyrin repeat-containing domain [Pseudocohnilembus persalinus]|eukprot:KRX08044.1 Ankyrin repeat-containing domain [Pseudocohnilembus persalinus]
MQNSRFEYNRDDVRQFDDKQCTPLHYAVKNQDIDFCEWLLKKGADPNQKTQNNNTPLHIAFKENNLFIIGMLIDHGGDLNLLNQDGFTPCGMGSIETLTRLNLVDAVIMGKNQENFDNNRLLKVKPFEEFKEQRLHIKKFYPLQKNEYREDQVDTIKIEEYISI